MKRRASRLSLHRETLTTLSRFELERPAGAGVTTYGYTECIQPSVILSCYSYCPTNCVSKCGTCDQACFLTTSQAC